VNLARINVLVGPRNGPAGHALAAALATPSAGHAPFVVIARPGVPAKPLTLYVNKAQTYGDAASREIAASVARVACVAAAGGVPAPQAAQAWVLGSACVEHAGVRGFARAIRQRAGCARNEAHGQRAIRTRPRNYTPCDLLNDYTAGRCVPRAPRPPQGAFANDRRNAA
jgi:formaldehyde-activating enzyme